jgi:hypothetical protein
MGAVNAFIQDGLFINQVPAFTEMLQDLAQAADNAEPNNSD